MICPEHNANYQIVRTTYEQWALILGPLVVGMLVALFATEVAPEDYDSHTEDPPKVNRNG